MSLKPVSQFTEKIKVLLTDIDDTLTDEGTLRADAYAALWKLKDHGIDVLPVTGRPAGWCDMVARFWPVCGIVGENGGFYFRYDHHRKKMIRKYVFSSAVQLKNQAKLQKLGQKILKQVPGSAISADQFSRQMDLAIDFCEDVKPLPRKKVLKIQEMFEAHGAQAKISSIHVNGWFGDYSKLSQSLQFLKTELKISAARAKEVCAYIGDSPNDEPMWSYFPHSIGVANVLNFKDQIQSLPNFITQNPGGRGFAELCNQVLAHS